jgi:hypothetical protein
VRSAAARSWAAVFPLAVSLVICMCPIALSQTAKDDALWSIDFGAVSLSEAFDQLTQVTGIKIFTTKPFDHTISPKRYLNRSIEQILKDMLKQVNYAAVWHYSESGVESIGILVFDRKSAESRSAESSVRREDTIRTPRPRSSGPVRFHSGERAGSPEREASVEEPPSEPEEPEERDVDEEDEESEASATEEDDRSDLASSDDETEPAAEESKGKKGPSGAQGDESEE